MNAGDLWNRVKRDNPNAPISVSDCAEFLAMYRAMKDLEAEREEANHQAAMEAVWESEHGNY